jgi:hypothetical protein
MREIKATLLQQFESHLLKISLVRLRAEIRIKGLGFRRTQYRFVADRRAVLSWRGFKARFCRIGVSSMYAMLGA